MFKSDSPLVNFLNKITDIVLLNILLIVVSLPIITIGAAWTAAYYVTVKMVKNEESYLLKDFFKSFRQNFFQATTIWMINIVVVGIYSLALYTCSGGSIDSMSRSMFVVFVIIGVCIAAMMVFVYPILSHFDNTVANTIRNAALLSIGNLPYAVWFMALSALPVIILCTPLGSRALPILLIVGLSGPIYICSFGWQKIFIRLEPREVSEDSEQKEESEQSE